MHFQRILIATDFSDASRIAVLRGIDLAKQFGAEIHLFHAVPISQVSILPPIDSAPTAEDWLRASPGSRRDVDGRTCRRPQLCANAKSRRRSARLTLPPRVSFTTPKKSTRISWYSGLTADVDYAEWSWEA